jgi:thiol-disulfide isomerase/thioredoxin
MVDEPEQARETAARGAAVPPAAEADGSGRGSEAVGPPASGGDRPASAVANEPDDVTRGEGRSGGVARGDREFGRVARGEFGDVTRGEGGSGDVTRGDGESGDVTRGEGGSGDVTRGDGELGGVMRGEGELGGAAPGGSVVPDVRDEPGVVEQAPPGDDRLGADLLERLGVGPAAATLLQFSSAFCAPCRAVRRISAEVAALLPGVQHIEVDAESHLAEVRELGIWRTPTLLLLDADGRVTKRATGVPSKPQLIAALAEILPAGP